MNALRMTTVVALATIVAACAPAATSPTTSPLPSDSVPEVLNFEVATVDGNTFSGDQIYHTPTVMWFWAAWCAICNGEAHHLTEVATLMPEGVQLLGVPGGNSTQEDMEWFVDVHELDAFPHIIDPDGSLWMRFAVVNQPTFAFIDGAGNMTTVTGSLTAEEIRERAEGLVTPAT